MDLISFLVHLDQYLGIIIEQYGVLTYAILFLIVFAETGLVVTPFLPGDSLLFAVGAFAARGVMSPFVLIPLLVLAAVAGDAVNYWVGAKAGERILGKTKLIKEEHIERTKRFYDRWGGRAVVFARFVPIVRTVAPFVAGIAHMQYRRFTFFNILGALLWVPSFTLAGYFFGTISVIQENFTVAIIILIILSLLPPAIEIIRVRRESIENERQF